MILADKIINERKKNGWSQEELAEQLSVSRQSVSKWEGAQAVPDLQKIIMMADIFGVSTDYLLKDEIEAENSVVTNTNVVEAVSSSNVRRVSLEEASDYLNVTRLHTPKIANGVSLCILSPVILIALAALAFIPGSRITDAVAATIGMLVLLVMVAAAVYIFIVYGSKINKYEYIEKEIIETAYGVDGMLQERMKSIENRKTSYTALGVLMCILSPVPLIVTACVEMPDYVITWMVCVLLIVIAIAVNIFVRVGAEWSCCEQLLQVGEYTAANKIANKKVAKVAGIYWALVLTAYLAWSFITMRWDMTWIVWPIAAVFFGAVATLIKAFEKNA